MASNVEDGQDSQKLQTSQNPPSFRIRRAVSALAVAISSWLMPAIAQALPANWPATVIGTQVRLRAEPKREAKASGYVNRGQGLQVRWADDDWLEIVEGPRKGQFVNREFIQIRLSAGPPAAGADASATSAGMSPVRLDAKVIGSNVRLRGAASTKAPLVGTAMDGDTYVVRLHDANWCEILEPAEHAGHFISGQFLELLSRPEATGSAPAPAASAASGTTTELNASPAIDATASPR